MWGYCYWRLICVVEWYASPEIGIRLRAGIVIYQCLVLREVGYFAPIQARPLRAVAARWPQVQLIGIDSVAGMAAQARWPTETGCHAPTRTARRPAPADFALTTGQSPTPASLSRTAMPGRPGAGRHCSRLAQSGTVYVLFSRVVVSKAMQLPSKISECPRPCRFPFAVAGAIMIAQSKKFGSGALL